MWVALSRRIHEHVSGATGLAFCRVAPHCPKLNVLAAPRAATGCCNSTSRGVIAVLPEREYDFFFTMWARCADAGRYLVRSDCRPAAPKRDLKNLLHRSDVPAPNDVSNGALPSAFHARAWAKEACVLAPLCVGQTRRCFAQHRDGGSSRREATQVRSQPAPRSDEGHRRVLNPQGGRGSGGGGGGGARAERASRVLVLQLDYLICR